MLKRVRFKLIRVIKYLGAKNLLITSFPVAISIAVKTTPEALK